jgi:Fe-S-cluster formation regulator IscX/YfhJ
MQFFRCMAKYPDRVPSELSDSQISKLVSKLPAFDQDSSPSQEQIRKVSLVWMKMYDDNLEKVTFDNLASYEP